MVSMENLAVGDVVVLKSGGPKMTITAVEEQTAKTVWFNGSSQMDGKFSLQLLTRSEERKSSGGSISVKRTF